jgi:hypothetical protein
MSGNFSLLSSLRSCKVDPATAERVRSYRLFNTNDFCTLPIGYDSAGRPSCSYAAPKSPGCYSLHEKLGIENEARPRYGYYIRPMTSHQFGSYGHQMGSVISECRY